MEENKIIVIVAQEFYGNLTMTEIKEKNMDDFILGHLDERYNAEFFGDKIDRTIIDIPNTNLVIIYNKYQEEERLELKAELFKGRENEAKATAIIPEKSLTIYSRCIVCRRNEDGSFDSIEDDDYNVITKYLVA